MNETGCTTFGASVAPKVGGSSLGRIRLSFTIEKIVIHVLRLSQTHPETNPGICCYPARAAFTASLTTRPSARTPPACSLAWTCLITGPMSFGVGFCPVLASRSLTTLAPAAAPDEMTAAAPPRR